MEEQNNQTSPAEGKDLMTENTPEIRRDIKLDSAMVDKIKREVDFENKEADYNLKKEWNWIEAMYVTFQQNGITDFLPQLEEGTEEERSAYIYTFKNKIPRTMKPKTVGKDMSEKIPGGYNPEEDRFPICTIFLNETTDIEEEDYKPIETDEEPIVREGIIWNDKILEEFLNRKKKQVKELREEELEEHIEMPKAKNRFIRQFVIMDEHTMAMIAHYNPELIWDETDPVRIKAVRVFHTPLSVEQNKEKLKFLQYSAIFFIQKQVHLNDCKKLIREGLEERKETMDRLDEYQEATRKEEEEKKKKEEEENEMESFDDNNNSMQIDDGK